jgi:4,5-dihydroxyphthalate decarboxylase
VAGKLKLRVLIGDYEITRALREGAVEAEGIEFEFPNYPGYENIHHQVALEDICDVGEFNAPAYIAAASQKRPLTALPVFLHRRFRHGFIFVNKDRGIEKPADLVGKRVGGPIFQPAASVWIRGLLENEYGVPHRSITWVTEGPEIIDFKRHEGLRIEQLKPGQTIDDEFISGGIDAIIGPNPPRGIVVGLPHLGHLWPNYKELELAWYRKTGIFPIMHVTTILPGIVAKHPWAVASLMDAFEAAKRVAYRRLVNPRIVPLVWYRSYLAEERALFGPDPWEYGVTDANRKNLELLIGYVHQQGMSDRRMTVEEMFPAEAIAWKAKPSAPHPQTRATAE